MSKQFGSILQHVGMTEYISTALDTIPENQVQADVDHVLNKEIIYVNVVKALHFFSHTMLKYKKF